MCNTQTRSNSSGRSVRHTVARYTCHRPCKPWCLAVTDLVPHHRWQTCDLNHSAMKAKVDAVPRCAVPCCAVTQVCFTAVRELLAKTGVTPRQIGCVIVNCSLFNPTPSLSALIMNHFKMPSSVINYNLGGMGCSGALLQPSCPCFHGWPWFLLGHHACNTCCGYRRVQEQSPHCSRSMLGLL
jgi:hypothetical protein